VEFSHAHIFNFLCILPFEFDYNLRKFTNQLNHTPSEKGVIGVLTYYQLLQIRNILYSHCFI